MTTSGSIKGLSSKPWFYRATTSGFKKHYFVGQYTFHPAMCPFYSRVVFNLAMRMLLIILASLSPKWMRVIDHPLIHQLIVTSLLSLLTEYFSRNKTYLQILFQIFIRQGSDLSPSTLGFRSRGCRWAFYQHPWQVLRGLSDETNHKLPPVSLRGPTLQGLSFA